MLPEAGRVPVPPWDIGLTGKLEYDVRVQALYDLSQAMEIECIRAECYLKLAVSVPPRNIGLTGKLEYDVRVLSTGPL